MRRPTVLLADDHKIILEGLRTLLKSDFELVGAVQDGHALVSNVKRLDPDIVVTDISMPLLNGIEAVEKLNKINTRSKIIVLTMHSEVAYAIRALEAGAVGFVLKHAAPSELISAIHTVLGGRTYVSPKVAENMGGQRASAPQDPINKLTLRQREVLQLLAEGNSAKKIANILHISPRTAEFHKYRIMEDLNIHSSAELIQFAIKNGVVTV